MLSQPEACANAGRFLSAGGRFPCGSPHPASRHIADATDRHGKDNAPRQVYHGQLSGLPDRQMVIVNFLALSWRNSGETTL